MKSYRMLQCSLKRVTEKGEVRSVTWLPQKYAVKGKILEIQNDGKWENGWVVDEVYTGMIMDLDKINIVEPQYRHTREVSDV